MTFQEILETTLEKFDCQTGTLHRIDSGTGLLSLLAQKGIPDFLLDKIDQIPIGKGIAGAAAKTAEPVQMCNLQTDTSGVARPDAKQTQVEGAIAVPIFGSEQQVIGVLGIGKMKPYEFSDAEISELQTTAGDLAQLL